MTTKTNTCVLRVVLTRFHKRKQSDMFQFFISLSDFAISVSGWLASEKKRRCRGRMGDSLPVLFFSVQFSAQRFVLSHKKQRETASFYPRHTLTLHSHTYTETHSFNVLTQLGK